MLLLVVSIAACGNSGGENNGQLDADSSPGISADLPDEENFQEPSEEEIAANELEDFSGRDHAISGVSPGSVAPGEPFDVDLTVSVASNTTAVEIELTLPDGVSIVGGDCPLGSGVIVCDSVGSLTSSNDETVTVQLVIDPVSPLGVDGGAVDLVAVVTDLFARRDGLSEGGEFNPSDNTLLLTITTEAP